MAHSTRFLTFSGLLEPTVAAPRESNSQTCHGIADLVGASDRMARVYDLVKRVAPTRSTVLVQGETGTGKELIARAIHVASRRAQRPFVPVDCNALSREPPRERAVRSRQGGVHRSAERQERTLRGGGRRNVLSRRGGRAQPLRAGKAPPGPPGARGEASGGRRELQGRRPGHRRDQQEPRRARGRGAVQGGLFYRLSVVTIVMPPLRDRREDIPAPGQALPHVLHRRERQGAVRDLARGDRGTPPARLARQCPRARARHRARGRSHLERGAASRGPAPEASRPRPATRSARRGRPGPARCRRDSRRSRPEARPLEQEARRAAARHSPPYPLPVDQAIPDSPRRGVRRTASLLVRAPHHANLPDPLHSASRDEGIPVTG